MKKSWLHLGAIGSLAILTSSCGGGDNKPTTTPSASPTPTTSPAAANPAATPAPVAAAPTTPATAPVSTINTAPLVPGTKPKSVSPDVSAGLIPPTNGETWARAVAKGRTDPFGVAALQMPISLTARKIAQSGINRPLPKIASAGNGAGSGERVLPTDFPSSSGNKKRSMPITPSAIKSGTDIAAIPRTGINRPLPKIAVAVGANSTSSTSAPAAKSGKLPKIAFKPMPSGKSPLKPTNIGASETPKLPQVIAAKSEPVAEQVLQAMAVEVSGIIEVEGKTQVIVKLPTETTSRYVDVGDRLAGNIFVKRVEGQSTLSPTVVFEENGREVERKVGDKAPATAAK